MDELDRYLKTARKRGYVSLNHIKIIRAEIMNRKGIRLRIYKLHGKYYLTHKDTHKPD